MAGGRGNRPLDVNVVSGAIQSLSSIASVSSLPAVTITGSPSFSMIATGVTATGAGTTVACFPPARTLAMFLHSSLNFTGASVRIEGSYNDVEYATIGSTVTIIPSQNLYSSVGDSPVNYFRYNVATSSPGGGTLSVRLIGLP